MKKLSAYLLLLSLIIIFISACSSGSDTPPVTPSPPSVGDVQLRADAGDKQVTLYWPIVNGANTYNIYYIESTSQPSSTVMKASGTPITGLISAPHPIVDLTNGKTYWFAFTAVNTYTGESALSEIIPAIPSAPPPPAAPKNVRANAGDAEVTVTWTPVTAVPAVVSYNIHLSCTDGINYEIGLLTVPGQPTSSKTVNSGITWIIKPSTWADGLENERLCAFTLTAETAEIGPSSEVTATPSTTTNTIGPVTDGSVVESISATTGTSQQVTISWVALSGANPYTSYNLYYYPDGGDPGSATRIPEVGNGDAVTGLTNGTLYHFYLKSTIASSPSFAVFVTPSTTPPPMAPVLEPPTLVGSTVTLTWNVVTATPPVTSYYVYVGTAQGVTRDTGAPSLVSDLSVPLTTDATLPTGTYYIVVTAVNANGESTESNEVSVTVP
jgi:hypothetical protein